MSYFFFFQAEDGIRDDLVTGVQTCALPISQEIRASGYNRALTLTANRAGAHPGTHEIGFDTADDTITLRHTARSREGFARGALRAARWLAGKQGVFEFREILGELS